ncbi:ABC transporter substrate-binding protein [Robertkochia marina]|uniref:ABC transporter substrate-binding protein n=1 Tax=Robertkochia marina TaxID=1227945 RepID=A0A4S3M0A3_9FLAO|nr:ABC transporter substrate-binding protein [Robertkochia marina]THD67467.1 ABC transporter substrate-binding protein [Robertkochia marina]TRZ44664.1 ABC transporter substrate-binding protein [Robertkochia marina]
MKSYPSGISFFCLLIFSSLLVLSGCNDNTAPVSSTNSDGYATGFQVNRVSKDLTEVIVTQPWPEAQKPYKYAFLDREAAASASLNRDAYDAIVLTPVTSIIATSTTHIPALEALGALKSLRGFPDTRYISSKKAVKLVTDGSIQDLGVNESLNTELVLDLDPEVIVGFSIAGENESYDVLKRKGIPILYNGDWVEQHPLGKAEWIRFFGVMFQKEQIADSIFQEIAAQYNQAKALAAKAQKRPKVLSGAMYRDVWYLPAGDSWGAKFIEDANADYLWKESEGTGSLSLSFESVLSKAANADIWMGTAAFTSYPQLTASNEHYNQFKPFREKKVYTISKTTGPQGGVLFYELGPNRPDLVLKDMIHILHPELLPDHNPVFYKPLDLE